MKQLILLFLSFFISSPLFAADIVNLVSSWPHLQERHFIIYYSNRDDEPQARVILMRAENYYHAIADNLGYTRYGNFWTWDERVKIILFDSQSSFMAATGQPGWSQGFALPHTGFYKSRLIVSFSNQPGFIDEVLVHEISHLVLHDLVGFDKTIPLFFDEGVAQLLGKRDEELHLPILGRLLANGAAIPVTELLNYSLQGKEDSREVSMFYVESLYIVDFLIKTYGKEKFKELCRCLRDGKAFEEALKDVYYPELTSMEDLQAAWIKYVIQRM